MKRSLLGPFFRRYGWWYVPGMLFLVISVRLKTGIPQALGRAIDLLADVQNTTSRQVAGAAGNLALLALGVFCTVFIWRIRSIMDEPSIPPEEFEAAQPVSGDILMKDLTFRYPGQETDALSRVSFTVKPGQKLGIAGTTGSGKTTLLSLLLKFYPAPAGRSRGFPWPGRWWGSPPSCCWTTPSRRWTPGRSRKSPKTWKPCWRAKPPSSSATGSRR